MKNIQRFVYSMLLVFSFSYTVHSDPVVQAMGENFIRQLPLEWNAVQGDWKYFDVEDCFINGSTCYGNNPTSPYGYPFFNADSESKAMDFKLKQNDAVVIFFRTPPKMRYFGLTQYLFRRGTSPTTVFGSLSDTINNTRFATLNSNGSNNVFDEYAVLVWTGDMNSYSLIKSKLALQGISESQINFLPMAANLPLNIGESDQSDSFSMLMRTAMPDVQANFDAYKDEKPFFVLKVGPSAPTQIAAVPVVGYAEEQSGISEDPQLKSSLNELVADISKNYADQYDFAAQTVNYVSKVGWDCIAGTDKCAGDNHDALYSTDVSGSVKVKTLSDFVLVVGVNHQKTGKALYLNHTVYDVAKMAGIVSVDDLRLTTQSALYHAGIKNPRDPRISKYKNLYAYVISYRCGNTKHCLAIPAPTPEEPVGLNPGDTFFVMGRSYVEPTTGVRPMPEEIIKHQTFVATRRSK